MENLFFESVTSKFVFLEFKVIFQIFIERFSLYDCAVCPNRLFSKKKKSAIPVSITYTVYTFTLIYFLFYISTYWYNSRNATDLFPKKSST